MLEINCKIYVIEIFQIDIINAYGYPSEKYRIQTEDYYVLYLYRIPPAKPTKKVVFIMHGIISCAADFLVSGPEKALGK